MKTKSKRILLTNGSSTNTFHLAKLLHEDGYKIYVTDCKKNHFCKFSRSVEKSFLVPQADKEPDAYLNKINQIAKDYKIDTLIPTGNEIYLLSENRNRICENCRILATDYSLLSKFTNRQTLFDFLDQIGFETPATKLVHSHKDLSDVEFDKFTLEPLNDTPLVKSIEMHREKEYPQILIDKKTPWVAQEALEGDRHSAFSLCHRGKLLACSSFPIKSLHDQNKWNEIPPLKSLDHGGIYKWAEEFAKKTHFTGHLSFEFIELYTGELVCLGCRPTLSAGITLFHPKDEIHKAYLKHQKIEQQFFPPGRLKFRQLYLAEKVPTLIYHKFKPYFQRQVQKSNFNPLECRLYNMAKCF